MKKRNLKSTILATAMVVVMGVGGIMAYFTDFEETRNNFTFGEIEIELSEPNWEPYNATHVVPNESFLKDPTVTNISTTNNAAFAFVEVEIPYAEIITADLNGNLNNEGYATETELFFIDEDHFNANEWVELKGEINGVTYPTINEDDETVTHLFVYGKEVNGVVNCTRLEKGGRTTVFTEITACNAIESQGLEKLPTYIDIRSYAIQAENLNVDTEGENKPEGIIAAEDVWTILLNQGITDDAPVAAEEQ